MGSGLYGPWPYIQHHTGFTAHPPRCYIPGLLIAMCPPGLDSYYRDDNNAIAPPPPLPQP